MPRDQRRAILAGIDRLLARPPQSIAVALPAPDLPLGDPPLAQPRLMLLLSGRHRIDLAEGHVELAPDTGLVLASGAWLRRQHASGFRLFGLVFHRGFLRGLLNTYHADAPPHPPQVWHHTRRPPTPALWRQLAVLTDPSAAPAMRPSALLALLHGCRAMLAADPGQAEGDRGAALHQAMLAHCAEHLAQPLDRNRLAQHFGIHPNHVSRLFARHGGEGFARCLIRLRMERALTLLRQPELPIAVAAAACGYPRAEYFVTEFRRFHGSTPGRLRNAASPLRPGSR